MLLILNNVSSVLVVVGCWWMAHSYASQGIRSVAVSSSAVGISVLLTMVARNVDAIPASSVDWQIVATKSLFAVMLGAVIVHRGRREVMMKNLMKDPPPPACFDRIPQAVSRHRH